MTDYRGDEVDLARSVSRGLKQKEHDDALYSTGCVGILVLFFVVWGVISLALGGSGVAVAVGALIALAVSFALAWRLTRRYDR